MSNEMFIPLLDPRGHSSTNLWYIDSEREGITFNCFEVYTSMPVGGFYAEGEGTEEGTKEARTEQLTTWEVFVPFGTTAFLHWFDQHDVVIIATPYGPLEVASEYLKGAGECYVTMPDGTEQVFGAKEPLSFPAVAAHWEAAYPNLHFGGVYVNLYSNENEMD